MYQTRKMNISRNISLGKRQAGFIQNFIIPGIILIGLVIAGIAMLSSGSSTNTDNEKASMVANVVMSQSITVTGAVQRAEADGAIPTTATGVQSLADLVTGKYISSGAVPVPPAEAVNTGVWVYNKATYVASAAAANVGSVTADDVLFVKLDGTAAQAVCSRINNKLYGTSTVPAATVAAFTTAFGGSYAAAAIAAPTAATAGSVEGCVADATDYYYYKVVNVK